MKRNFFLLSCLANRSLTGQHLHHNLAGHIQLSSVMHSWRHSTLWRIATFSVGAIGSFGCRLFELNPGSLWPASPSQQELVRRWDSERERLRSAPRKLPEFAEITQNNGHYAVQGHSRSPIFGTNRKLIYDFLLVLNSNLPHISHRFRDIAVDRSKIAIFGYPSCV